MASVLQYVPVFVIARNTGSKSSPNFQRVPRSYITRISELTVDEKEDHSTEIAWKVMHAEGVDSASGKKDPDDPFFKEKDQVVLRFGWIGQLSRPHECIVTGIEPSFDSSGVSHVVKLRDHAFSLGHKMTQRSVNGLAIGMVVADVCKRNGLKMYAKASSGIFGLVNSVADLPAAMKTTLNEVQAGISDHQLIRRIARRIDHRITIKGDKLFFEKPDYGTAASRDYVWRGGRGNLISFKPASNTAHKGQAAAVETKAVGVDTKTKKKIEGKANAETDKGEPVLGKGSTTVDKATGLEKWKADTTGRHIAHPSSEKKHLEDHAKDSRARGEAKSIQANMEVYGNPQLERGQVVRVLNVGRKNSGNYRIAALKQQIGTGGFKTSAGLHRQGHASVKKGETKTTGKVNESKPAQAQKAPKTKVNIATGQESHFQ